MLFDTRFPWLMLALIILYCFFPILADLNIPLLGGFLVRSIENIQAFLLLFFAIISDLYICSLQLEDGKK